jgi:hypothetical protein
VVQASEQLKRGMVLGRRNMGGTARIAVACLVLLGTPGPGVDQHGLMLM